MRLALLLFGIHAMTHRHWSGHVIETNYKWSLDNYKRYIFEFFKSKGYEIDVFFSTYHSPIEKELMVDYKPRAHAFLPVDHNHIRGRNRHFRRVLSLCLNYSKTNKVIYDTVIITRFDLIFRDDFASSNINYNALNIVSILQLPRYICDNFFLIPFKLLDRFNAAVLSQTLSMQFHRLQPVFERYVGPINFIKDEKVQIGALTFYVIKKKKDLESQQQTHT